MRPLGSPNRGYKITEREIGEALGGLSKNEVAQIYLRAIRKCWRGPQHRYQTPQRWADDAERKREWKRRQSQAATVSESCVSK